MKLLGYLILSLAKITDLLLNLYTFVLAAAVLISWINPDPYNPIVRILRQLTDPVLDKIRQYMPSALRRLPMDISPIIALIFIILIQTILVNLLYDFSIPFLKR
ncbi:MAG: YggT family protein [Deltaproteobacteria bacterium]|nr:YggT family protein [Deltaproteobacteria bacterium]